MACTQCRTWVHNPARKAHHEKTTSDSTVLSGGMGRRWRRRCAHEQVTVMGFIESHVVRLAWREGRICAGGQGEANSDLGRETDNCDSYVGGNKGGNSGMYVTWVGGEKGTEEDQDLARCMCRRMEESGTSHIQGVLEGRLTFWFLLLQFLNVGDVVVWIA